MNNMIEQMLDQYDAETIYEKKNAVKEIMQEIVLCGLSRAGFFKKAAFYGGTALRIFYGLDRFSEDLDFSLMTENADFDLTVYFPILKQEVKSFGLNVTIAEKDKVKESNIKSAFLKGNTKEHLLLFYADQPISGIADTELIKIKFEVDINPPKYATFEHKYRLLPAPYEVNLYDAPSLFAGKIHAVICRAWKSRIKGRDLYDYVFYMARRTPVNLVHLRERLLQSKYIQENDECALQDVKKMLVERFGMIDYEQARKDVEPFIHDTASLDIWSADFFRQITEGLTAVTCKENRTAAHPIT